MKRTWFSFPFLSTVVLSSMTLLADISLPSKVENFQVWNRSRILRLDIIPSYVLQLCIFDR